MSKVLIVARTHMKDRVCIGGLVLSTNKSIRLLTSDGSKQPSTAVYNVGQWWDLDFQSVAVPTPPHVEDVLVHNAKYIGNQVRLSTFLMERVKLWRGGIDQMFDGCLASARQSCFISEHITPPNMSTGFWLPDVPLEQAKNPHYYMLHTNSMVKDEYNVRDQVLYIPYVGCSQALDIIPAGTLVRVSLARWFNRKCYLQLSGFYT